MRRKNSYFFHSSRLVSGLLIFSILFLFIFLNPIKTNSQSEESQCIACHTTAKKLIQIARIIKQTTPQTKKSKLTKGEG